MKVVEIFYSIQGEGLQMGLPTVFVRTSGCNLRCAWCDTKYAYYGGKEMSPREIVEESRKYPIKRAALTGGEPLLQRDINELIEMLDEDGYEVLVETNGSMNIGDLPRSRKVLVSLDIKCPSSGMSDKMDFSNLRLLNMNDQLKFVVKYRKDFDFAMGVITKFRPKTNIIFQPVGGRSAEKLVEWVLSSGIDARVMLQMHKIIWGKKRGV